MTLQIMTLTHGSDTIDLLSSGSGYRIQDWAPAVANRRRDYLGGVGPYEDVTEQIELSLHGSTISDKVQMLQKFADLISRYERGEESEPVLLTVKYTAGVTWATAFVGPDGSSPILEMPNVFLDHAARAELSPVLFRARRQGWWLEGQDRSDTETADHNGDIFIADLGATVADAFAASPVRLELTGWSNMRANALDNSFVVVGTGPLTGDVSARMIKGRPYTYSFDTDWASDLTDTTEGISSGVAKLTPTSADVWRRTYENTTSFDDSIRRWAVLVNYRNNGAYAYKIRAWATGSITGIEQTTDPIAIAGAASDPQWLYLGTIALNGPIEQAGIEVSADATGGTLDVHDIFYLAVDTPAQGRVIKITNASDSIGAILSSDTLHIDGNWNSSDGQRAYLYDESASAEITPFNIQGDALLYIEPGHKAVGVAVLGNGEGSSGTDPSWRFTQTASTTLITHDVGVICRRGALVIQSST